MKILIRISLFLLILILISCSTPCGQVEKLYKNKIFGNIDSKSVSGRGTRQLSLDKFKINEINYLYVAGDRSSLWNYIDVGDSIYKESFTFEISVVRENKIKIFTMQFPSCPKWINEK